MRFASLLAQINALQGNEFVAAWECIERLQGAIDQGGDMGGAGPRVRGGSKAGAGGAEAPRAKRSSVRLVEMQAMVARLKLLAVKPGVIKTQDEADAANAQSRAIGSTYAWQIGDEYYLVPVEVAA